MEMIELADSEQQMFFNFPPAAASGRDVLDVKQLSKSYGEQLVFSDLNLELQRGEKMAVVGVNGAGKSTLMRVLAGLEKKDRGKVRLGHNVKISYFGQHQAQELAPGLTVMETLSAVAGDMTTTQIRNLLGAFLFRGEEVDKKVQVLSGGEKSRVVLAMLLAQPFNFLILDEPTNHLDIQSREILLEALQKYSGTVILVSHDRHFLRSLANRVFEIDHGEMRIYEGNYAYYLSKNADRGEERGQGFEESRVQGKNTK